MRDFLFLAGLPRTGSTLLASLLAQHPDIHVTSTSCTSSIISQVRGFHFGESPYFDVRDSQSPFWSIAKGVLFGAHEAVTERVVVEKDRSWSLEVTLLERILPRQTKIIATVRPVTEVISSFMLLAAKNPGKTKIEKEVINSGKNVNEWTLSRAIWDKYVYSSWAGMKAGYEKNPEKFVVLPYDYIVESPSLAVEKILSQVGLDPQPLEINSIKNPCPENDAIYGIPGLHDVRPTLRRVSPPARTVMGEDCFDFWNNLSLDFWVG